MDHQARGRKRVKGEVVPFGKLFAAMTTLRRRDRVTELDVDVYEDATADIPLPILALAVTRWLRREAWFPSVAELLTEAEAARQEIRQAAKYEPCEQCVGGWVLIGDKSFGHDTYSKRCSCWRNHQQKLAELGVGGQPLALPPAVKHWNEVSE